jgi:ABC-type branched-subunit amino acid transport system substrate-binding protein/DNA-binding SARP family transcriptional activator
MPPYNRVMLVSVLGAVEVAGVRLTAPKPGVLLATLVANAGEPVTNDRLVDALWLDRVPRSAVDNLRVYVAQLRRALGEGRLLSRRGGYALVLGPGELDAGLFGEREQDVRRLTAANDPQGAARAAREALALWRGPAFDGLNLPETARDYAQRLEERRAVLTEDWVDLELALGRHREVIGDVRALVTAHPLRERPRAELMLALHRSGRRAEALEAYREAREVMVAELGLEPGAELRALEATILRDDPLPPPRSVPETSAAEAPALEPRASEVPARADSATGVPGADGTAREGTDRGVAVREGATAGVGRPVGMRWAWVAASTLLPLLLLLQSAQPHPQPQTAPSGRPSAQPAVQPAIPSQAPPTAGQVRGLVGDGVLTVATLLPMTGSLYFIGAAMSTGADLAVQDVNAAGGVLGRPVRLIKADSGDSTDDLASAAVGELIEQKTDVIVGAASNTVSLSVIDRVTEEGMVMISPSTTATMLTTSYDRGLFFRTSPSDVMQGRLVGRLLAEDGNRTAALIALDDSYGDVLVAEAEAELARSGVKVVKKIRYAEDDPDFSALKPIHADALVMIGFTETLDIMRRLDRGRQRWYLVDANLSDYSGDLPRGALTGTRGTLAGTEASPEFKARMRALDPALRDFSYAAEAYDAVVVAALAAQAAQGDLG